MTGGLSFGPPVHFRLSVVIVHSKVRGVSARTLERFASAAQRAAGVRGSVDVLITTSAQMRRLNQRFRGKNTTTDVLSFPLSHRGAEAQSKSLANFAGDLAISAQVAAQNARRMGHTTADELKVLVLHGMLHLAGHDHETDTGQMARKEARLRRVLGLPTALIERAGSANGEVHGGNRERRSLFSKSSVSQCLRGGCSTRRRS